MILLVILAASLIACNALGDIDTKNVVTVPPNCPPGQEWINGQCREVWPYNVVVVPPNCPPGQELINDLCRDVWRNSALFVAIENAEKNLLKKEKRQADDAVEEKLNAQPDQSESGIIETKNIISVPSQCPSGFRPDGLGICRPIFD